MEKDIEPFMDQLLDNEEDEEDDDEIVLDEINFYCQVIKEGRDCQRNGQCIRYLFNEGRFDACDSLIFEDPDCTEDKTILFVGEDN